MNQQLTAVQQLDIVLDLLYKERGNSRLAYIQSRLKAESKIEIDADELIRILNRLIKDGNVEFQDDLLKQHDPFKASPIIDRLYWISLDGKLLKEAKGYDQLIKNQKQQAIALEIENRVKKRNEILVIVGSFLAGLGAIGLVLVEIYKIVHHC